MKQAFSIAFPLLSLLVLGIAACEDPTTGGGPVAPGGDAGFGVDSGDVDPPVVNTCPAPTGEPTKHQGNITADETWAAGVHVLTFDISIRGATLTIAPCAIIQTPSGRQIGVGFQSANPGKLVAKGEAGKPIIFQGADDTAKWGGILVNPSATAELTYVEIKNGGQISGSRGGAALHVLGDGTKPLQKTTTVDHVTIEGSEKYGAILETKGGFTDASTNLIIKGAAQTPLRVSANSVGTVPLGKYTGNGIDHIRMYGDIIDADVTMHDRGVPYEPGNDGQFPEISVAGTVAGQALLTIEAGVTIRFTKHPSSGLHIQRASGTAPSTAALRVLGTAEKPVVFTSNEAAPAPGDWLGIMLRGVPDPRTKIDYARVEFAGADTGTRNFSCGTVPSPDPASNEAAIQIYGQPTSAFVTNTTITKCAANAFERGWSGTPVDFLPTNTITEIAWCKQTYPRPTAGACPDPAPCE